MGFSSYTFKALVFNLDIIKPSQPFISLHFNSTFASPFYYCYDTSYTRFYFVCFFFLPIFFHLDYVLLLCILYLDYVLLCIILHHFTAPFRISFSVSQYLPLSIFPYSAFLLFTRTTFLFSSSNHIFSSYLCYFQFFPFQTTLPDEG